MKIKSAYLTLRGAAKAKSLLGVILLGCAGATLAHAGTDTWTNGTSDAGNESWATTTNWSPSGLPAGTDTALFDTGGDTSAITVGTESIGYLQFGQAAESSSSTALAYTLGTGTLDFATTSAESTSNTTATTPIIGYFGSANTANETINSNIVLDNGYSGSTTYYYQIINSSAGATNSSKGEIVINGTITDAATQEADLDLGNSATGTYGNLVFGGSITGARLAQLGTQGALVFAPTSSATLTDSGNGGNYGITLDTGHSAETNPNVEASTGNTIVVGGNAIDYDYNQSTSGASSFNIQVDSGATMAVGGLYDGGTSTTVGTTQTVILDGAGTGVVYGNDTVRNPVGYTTSQDTASLVKDGTGSWAFTGAGGGITATRGETYQGGTSVEDGTFLVIGGTTAATSPTGIGQVTVDPTNSAEGSNAKPVLGGTGWIAGAVVVNSGGEIAPGGTATGGASTNASITSPIGSIGKLTLANNLTAEAGATFAFDLNSSGTFSASKGQSDNITATTASTTVTLGNGSFGYATLSLNDIGSTTLSTGDYFDILDYTALSGTFNGLANGADITVGQNEYTINYGTGTNSDITLTFAAAAPEPSTWALLLVGGLVGLGLRHRFRRGGA